MSKLPFTKPCAPKDTKRLKNDLTVVNKKWTKCNGNFMRCCLLFCLAPDQQWIYSNISYEHEMATVAPIARRCVGSKYIWHYGCKQSVHQSAGKQHYQFIEQQQQLKLNNLQRKRTGFSSTARSNGSRLHGRGSRQLSDWRVRGCYIKRNRDSRGNIQAGRAMRVAQVVQDVKRFWTQGCGSSRVVSRCPCVSGYGYGGNSMSLSWCDWQASHGVVATKS